MTEHIWVKPVGNWAVNVSQYGTESCTPGHSYGPAVRDHYLLHFIIGGEGVFSRGGQDYHLAAGQGFLICPEEITCYTSSREAPWSYCWMGFSGVDTAHLLAELGLEASSPVFTFRDVAEITNAFERLHRIQETELSGQLELTAVLYLLLSRIRPTVLPSVPAPHRYGGGREYVESAILYIQENYASAITVGGLAAHLGLNRSYLSALFRAHTKVSPKQFLCNVRLSKAAKLLEDGRLSVGQVAKSVGYEDPLLFSRMFRAAHGVPPREYRKRFER